MTIQFSILLRIMCFIQLFLLLGSSCMAASRSFWVDSRKGDDTCDGLTPQTAWKTLDKLSRSEFMPGDVVLFARGSCFDGEFVVRASGTVSEPVLLTSYGKKSLPAPEFTNSAKDGVGFGNCIRLCGDYIRVENLAFRHTLAEIPLKHSIGDFTDMWQMGAVVIDSASRYCVVRGNEFEDCGVGIKSNGEHALIEGNYLYDCTRVLKQWSWGPIAIWLGADHQTVRYNVIRNYRVEHDSVVWRTTGPKGADGGAIEVDDGRVAKRHIEIHHNFSQGCQGFLEVTYKDVVTAPDYRDLYVHDNISDDYQSFLLLWQGRGCRFENNTIIRRKRNGNEQGVFRITQPKSANEIDRNLILTMDSVVIFNNRANARTVIGDNLYCSLSGELVFGRENAGSQAVIATLSQLPTGYGARTTQRKYPWFDRLCNVKRLLNSEYSEVKILK